MSAPGVSSAVDDMLRRFIKDVQLAADLYILYMMVCLFAVAPASVYVSSLKTRLLRSFFTISQLYFVVIVVSIMWVGPLIVENVNLDALIQFLKNLAGDPCYIQPQFLSRITTNLNFACDTVDQVKQSINSDGYRIELFHSTMKNYAICDSSVYGNDASKPPAIAKLWEMVELADSQRLEPFQGVTCTINPVSASENSNSTVFKGNLLKEFMIAPGSTNIETDGKLAVTAFLIILAISGKFILVNFSYRITRAFDPLCFHNGMVEVLDSEKVPKEINVHTLSEYLRAQNYIGLFFWSFFAVSFFVQTMVDTFGYSEMFAVFLFCAVSMWVVLHITLQKTYKIWCGVFLLELLALSIAIGKLIHVVSGDLLSSSMVCITAVLLSIGVVVTMSKVELIYCFPPVFSGDNDDKRATYFLRFIILLVLVGLGVIGWQFFLVLEGVAEKINSLAGVVCLVAFACFIACYMVYRVLGKNQNSSSIIAAEGRTRVQFSANGNEDICTRIVQAVRDFVQGFRWCFTNQEKNVLKAAKPPRI